MLKDKNILLGVTGGIAAYKAAMLVRLFKRQGANVRVIMTRAAKDFITPLTMATLSEQPILVENFDPENGAWNSHVSLGLWADVFVVAPATANTLAKMACGVADNLLLCSYLSARCPVVVAPAMDLDMYAHAATQANLQVLVERGVIVVEPGDGFLASGLMGKGRMCEPEGVVEVVCSVLRPSSCHNHSFRSSCSSGVSSESAGGDMNSVLRGKRVLVTAGATVERIDPVRYVSNFSTGKMGYALCDELRARGAEVVLVSGPSVCAAAQGVERVDVESAEQMFQAVKSRFGGCDIAVFCAAVADYRPVAVANQKIKHSQVEMTLQLCATKDIAAEMGRVKRAGQVTVGFALETENGEAHARGKLVGKCLDGIVLNSVGGDGDNDGVGFGVDTNRVTILWGTNSKREYALKSKREVAVDVVDWLEGYLVDRVSAGSM